MFIVAIQRAGIEKPDPVKGLNHKHTNFGQGFICDIQYDGSRFQLEVNSEKQTLIDSALHNVAVCQIGFRESEGIFRKSLMFGIPMYYVFSDSKLLVSTNLRLLQRYGIKLREDPRTLPEYFVYRYVTPPSTLLEGVNCVPVGGSLRFRLTHDKIQVDKLVWTNVFEKTAQPLKFADSVELIAEDMRKDIQSLGSYRDNVGCLLSGGVDSSTLFKLAKDYLSLNESHSTGYPFEDPAYNGERLYAEAAAKTLGSTHHYHAFSTNLFLHALIDAIDHAEIPVVHLQSVLLELVFGQALSARERIVLNGQGADGIFGTNMMFTYQLYQHLVHSPFAPLMGFLGRTPANRSFPYRKLHEWSRMNWSLDLTAPHHAIGLLGAVGDKRWVKKYYRVDDYEILENRLKAIVHFDPSSILDALSILDFIGDVDLTQIVWGQIAAAHGRRTHYTFNSEGLIRAASNTPWDEKLTEPKRLGREVARRLGTLVGAASKNPSGEQKRLGRSVARQLGVPQSILARPKLSFGVPAARWAGREGVIEPILKVAAPVVDIEFIRTFQTSDEQTAMIFWGWVNYAIWKRLVINGEDREVLHAELDAAIRDATS